MFAGQLSRVSDIAFLIQDERNDMVIKPVQGSNIVLVDFLGAETINLGLQHTGYVFFNSAVKY